MTAPLTKWKYHNILSVSVFLGLTQRMTGPSEASQLELLELLKQDFYRQNILHAGRSVQASNT